MWKAEIDVLFAWYMYLSLFSLQSPPTSPGAAGSAGIDGADTDSQILWQNLPRPEDSLQVSAEFTWKVVCPFSNRLVKNNIDTCSHGNTCTKDI